MIPVQFRVGVPIGFWSLSPPLGLLRKLDRGRPGRELPIMTVTADAKRRVILRAAEPGDRFDVQVSHDGTMLLTKLVPVTNMDKPNRVRFIRRNGRTVGVTERPIDVAAVKAVLAEFP